MDDVALGVKVFSRVNKLENLLDSVEESDINTVYVADDGEMTDEKRKLYSRSFDFDLNLIDLEYDAGLGYGRAEIVKQLDAEYLLIVDSDHTVPENVNVLRTILENNSQIGGVSGLIFERGHLRGACNDLFEHDDVLVRDVNEEKRTYYQDGVPFLYFDFIPNAALFRRDCLEDYCWDREYVIGSEHIDFYVGHMKTTDWRFATCPAVVFDHYPGGSSGYLLARQNAAKLRRSREYFIRKWGYKATVWKSDFMSPNSKHAILNHILGEFVDEQKLVQINLFLNKLEQPLYMIRNAKHRVERISGIR